ncbi:MAG: exodeoxyribonuclease VII large subunit [Saprospiraceae bacterium]|nr:exodeoxyribonuclease VII large subunit [Saprospiraceae bacterium]
MHSLSDLLTDVRHAVLLNFDQPLWIKAEIAQRSSSNGHAYLTLVEKEAGVSKLRARAEAAIWKTNLRKIRSKLKHPIGDLLAIGAEVAMLVQVTFHELYGLKLSVLDIDEQHTLGQLELQKIETISRLKKEGLLDANAQIAKPLVWQRLAVISSARAAGFADFQAQLKNNAAGYKIAISLFEATVQGDRAKEQIVQRLAQIGRQKEAFDLVLILRGGGSKLDLRGFDEYEVCRAIAMSPLPVMTGIGHETDASVADMVSSLSVKTPTAAAVAILDNLGQFEAALDQLLSGIQREVDATMTREHEQLIHALQRVRLLSNFLLDKEHTQLVSTADKVHWNLKHALQREHSTLAAIQAQVKALDPSETLRRGYSITTDEHHNVIQSTTHLEVEDSIITHLHNRKLSSTITKIELHESNS